MKTKCCICKTGLAADEKFQYKKKSYCGICLAWILLPRVKKLEIAHRTAKDLLEDITDFVTSQPWCIEDIIPGYYKKEDKIMRLK